jgi:site-specific DNA-cytosine methylase
MEKGLLDAAPIWSDLKTFPYKDFHGLVDILIAGYPCQPFSSAGKRAGKEDPRHLWPWIADGIRLLQPTMCFFENVEGHISLGLSTVISDLEELGYKVSWGIFSAREVGAPHQRKRLFIMAHNKSKTSRGLPMREETQESKFGFNCQTRVGAWPSRPGQQQYAWEPPRVVGGKLEDSKLIGRRGRSDGDAGGLCGEIQTAGSCGSGREEVLSNSIGNRPHNSTDEQIMEGEGIDKLQVEQSRDSEAMGNAECRRRAGRDVNRETTKDTGAGCINGNEAMGNASQLFSNGSDNNSRISERSKEISKSGNAGWNELGNAECIRIPTSREHGAMDEASGIPTDGEGREPSQADPESSATREREGDGCNAAERSKIKCEMGRDAYEPSIGMDLSELSGISHKELAEICDWMVKTESRTDELRLLGNGVVPATATRAFLTLIEELNK